MLDIIVIYIGIPFLLSLVAYFALVFIKCGYFKSIEASVLEKPPVLSDTITIFYKYVIGSYSNAYKTLKIAGDILPQENAILMGIFYEDDNTKLIECQGAVGCIYKVNDKPLFEENFAIQLKRWGFEKMVCHKVDRAIYCKENYSSVISQMHLKNIRSKFNKFIEEKRLEVGNCTVEIYKKSADCQPFVEIIRPLDHVEDFYVPEYLNAEQLEALVNRGRFDIEESATESYDEEEEEEGITSASQLDEEEDEDEEEDGELIHRTNNAGANV